MSSKAADWANFGTYLGGTLTIVSIVLLYLNLQSQQKQTDIMSAERTETTFFHLLKYHRNLSDAACITTEKITKKIKKAPFVYTGRQIFEYAINEIEIIKVALKTNYYMGDYDEVDVNMRLEAICGGDTPETYESLHTECEIKQCNATYGITREGWKDLHDSEDTQMEAYKLFMQKWNGSFEVYFRRTKQLLRFLVEHDELDAIEYAKYIQMQMTLNEIKFIELHARYDLELSRLLKETLLTNTN